MQEKKARYGKFFARTLFGSSLTFLITLVTTIMFLFSNRNKEECLVFLICSVICLLITILLTMRLNKRTPQAERKATWLRAWRLGARLSIKGGLVFARIFNKGMFGNSESIDVPDEDYYVPHWYDSRGKVRINGVEYKVGRSGDYIKMDSEWVRVFRASNGDPYIEKDGEKIWLE